MYYNLASTAQQKDFQAKQFINATADTIDELSFTMQAEIQALRKENEELRARVERLEAIVATNPPTNTSPKSEPIFADIEISKDSLNQLRKDIIKSIQF